MFRIVFGVDRVFCSIRLDKVDEGSAIQDYLLEKTGQRTVPNIFINQKHVGGKLR
jgi:glutaredoxin 3